MLIGRLSQMIPPPCLYDTVIQSLCSIEKRFIWTPFHGPSYTIESQWGKFGTLLPPQGCNLLPPFWGMVLQSLPASSNVANFTFLWNPLSELRGVKVFRNVKSNAVFFAPILPLGQTSYPRSLIKVIAHHSRLGRTFWHLIHGSVTKTAGGVVRRKKWNLEKADNTNVALPYMASTIN